MKANFKFIRNFSLIILAGFVFAACSKKNGTSNDLVGTWTSGTSTITAMVGSKTLTQYFTDVVGLSSTVAQQYTNLFNQTAQQSIAGSIQVKSDGTYTSTLGGTNDTGTWKLSSDSKTLTVDPSSGTPITFNVVELTSSRLHVTFTQTDSQDLNGDGVPETITINIDLTFTK
jgi:Lipocalin-like domain (DUF4923)